MADVPRTSQVYLEKPVLGIPTPKPGQRGTKPTRIQVLNGVKPLAVHQDAFGTVYQLPSFKGKLQIVDLFVQRLKFLEAG